MIDCHDACRRPAPHDVCAAILAGEPFVLGRHALTIQGDEEPGHYLLHRHAIEGDQPAVAPVPIDKGLLHWAIDRGEVRLLYARRSSPDGVRLVRNGCGAALERGRPRTPSGAGAAA